MFPFSGPYLLGLKALSIFLGTLILGYIVRAFVLRWIGKLTVKTETRIDDILIHPLRRPLPLWFAVPGFTDSSLDFTLFCYIRDFVDQYLVQCELRKCVLKRFRTEGIEIPYPQHTPHLAEGISIRLSQG